jgi:hydrogenase maturation protease
VDAGLSPGTVVILEAPPSPSPTAQASIHSFAVGDLLVLARHRGIPLAEVVVMGIQVGEIVPGIGLSPTILASIDRARDEALRIISGWQ